MSENGKFEYKIFIYLFIYLDNNVISLKVFYKFITFYTYTSSFFSLLLIMLIHLLSYVYFFILVIIIIRKKRQIKTKAISYLQIIKLFYRCTERMLFVITTTLMLLPIVFGNLGFSK